MLIPQLTPSDCSDAVVGVPPPAHFRPLAGVPTNVRWKNVAYSPSVGLTSAQRAGLRYETKVHDAFTKALGDSYRVEPHLHFAVNGVFHTARPDAIHLDVTGRATIFEIKSRHTSDAWWQLRRKYEPLVQCLKFVNVVSCVEVVPSYDPSAGFPEPVTKYDSLEVLLQSPSAPFKVMIWKPRNY